MGQLARLGGVAICLVSVTSSVAVARTRFATLSTVYPGVDFAGNLDYGFRAAEGVVRAQYNDRQGTVRVIGRAVVDNASFRGQVYANAGLLAQTGIDGAIVGDVYRVTSRGRGTYQGRLINSTGF
jgi:hypothetical protein